MNSRVFAFCGAALALLLAPLAAHAQGVGGLGLAGGAGGGAGGAVSQAGVHIDANGVLRVNQVRDPFGALAKQRMAEAKARIDADVARPSKLRKVSLTRLEKAVAAKLAKGQPIDLEMQYLAGMTSIKYVFVYPDSGDIVIAGPAEGFFMAPTGHVVGASSGEAVLDLEDVVVALRMYGPDGEGPAVVGCSIDPTREGLARMQQFLASLRNIAPSDDRRIALGLRESLGLQTVSLQGVPTTTHFAQVLLEADYRMKLIAIGLEPAPRGVTPYIKKATAGSVAANALKRWYFTPNYEALRVSDDDLALELVGQGVKLIGEDELVRPDGTRVEAARKDRASQLFVNSFTAKYGDVAKSTPVYGQLKNCIDLTIVAAFMKSKGFYDRVDWRMETFGNEAKFAVNTRNTPKKVETAVNVVWKGRTLLTPVGGGVNIQPKQALYPSNVTADSEGEVKAARDAVQLGGLPADQWWWD